MGNGGGVRQETGAKWRGAFKSKRPRSGAILYSLMERAGKGKQGGGGQRQREGNEASHQLNCQKI